ncbi:MAG TPA: hypothetical protein VFK50_04780 [Sphingomicrobium sp.]|nr:hypothetical protein [Sphingomicrobium sp.]
MAKQLTRAAALQNRAFLRILARTGNVRLAARQVGVAHTTFLHRRSRQAGFALRWDAALAVAGARLAKGDERWAPSTIASPGNGPQQPVRHAGGMAAAAACRGEDQARHRTAGGEVQVTRLKDGRVQIRRAQPGRLTPAAEQAFLAALSATCNVSLAAAAVGASPRAFYRRKRMDPAFAREYREALRRGYERIELALLEAGLAGSHSQDDWRRNDPPAMPPMSVNQGLQLMYLHQKEARLKAEPWPIKRLRGETTEMHCIRLAAMAEAEAQRRRDEFEMAEAERWARGEPAWGPAGEAVRRELGLGEEAALPDLAQVTGWSRADAGKRQDAETALFGGWRIEEMEARQDGEEGGAE